MSAAVRGGGRAGRLHRRVHGVCMRARPAGPPSADPTEHGKTAWPRARNTCLPKKSERERSGPLRQRGCGGACACGCACVRLWGGGELCSNYAPMRPTRRARSGKKLWKEVCSFWFRYFARGCPVRGLQRRDGKTREACGARRFRYRTRISSCAAVSLANIWRHGRLR